MTNTEIEEKENKMLSRREIKINFASDKTPSLLESLKFVSEKFSSPEEKIAIKKVKGKFGSKEFLIEANIYDSREEKEKIEPKEKKKKIKEENLKQAAA